MKKYYILIDPLNKQSSGITNYIYNSSILLSEYYNVIVYSIRASELIDDFAKRIALNISEIDFNSVVCIEVPETYSISRYIDPIYPIHVRLHCSKLIGQFIQGKKIDKSLIDLESQEIRKATWVSSPSKINYYFTRYFYNLPNRVSIFPNPQLIEKSKKSKYLSKEANKKK